MAYILVKHTVKNYETWKPIFDEHGATRKAAGSKSTQVLRNTANPNEVVILMGWDTVANAQKFAGSEDLKATMQRAGVEGRPEVLFLSDTGTAAV
jgi:heme-degrading monooxygenase HmoA